MSQSTSGLSTRKLARYDYTLNGVNDVCWYELDDELSGLENLTLEGAKDITLSYETRTAEV